MKFRTYGHSLMHGVCGEVLEYAPQRVQRRFENAFKKGCKDIDDRRWVQAVMSNFASNLGITEGQAIQLFTGADDVTPLRKIAERHRAKYSPAKRLGYNKATGEVIEEDTVESRKYYFYDRLVNMPQHQLAAEVRGAFGDALLVRHAKDSVDA